MSGVRELSVQRVAEMVRQERPLRLIDVRESHERAICVLPASLQLTERLADDLLTAGPTPELLIFICHHGGRSRAAAEYFQRQGFEVAHMQGGIDAWAREIDASLTRY